MTVNDFKYKSSFSFYNTLSVQTNSCKFEEHYNSTQENDLEELVGEHSHKRAKFCKDTFIHGKQRQPTDVISAIGNNFLLAKSLIKFFLEPAQNVLLLLQYFLKDADKLISPEF